MVNVSELLARKSAQDQARTAERQADRENLSNMRSAGVELITTDPDYYQKYLTLQGDNLRCSAGNVVLTMLQIEGCTHIGSLAYWHDLGRFVKDEEMKEGAKVFVPARNHGRGYLMGDYYDITQTTGKPVREPAKLEENSNRMEIALVALMNTSPVPLRADKTLTVPASYDPQKLEISVNPDRGTLEVFTALATEIAYASFHDRGRNSAFDRESCALDAESVGYLVCRRLGADCLPPKADTLGALYEGMDIEDRERGLNQLCAVARNISDRVDRAIQPRQQVQSRSYASAR